MTPFSTPPTKSQILERITGYLVHSGGIIAEEHNEIETALLDVLFTDRPLLGDIKEVACTDTYISLNFETSGTNIGRGKVGSERYGWAICNGSNGTIDKRGNVSIGYDSVSYPTLAPLGVAGNQGGAKTHTLNVQEMPPHSHNVIPYAGVQGTNANAHISSGVNGASYEKTGTTGGAGSSTAGNTTGGSTVAHNNMQPYIVTLFIQKIVTPY